MIASGWPVRSVRVLLQTVGLLGPAGCLLLAVSPLVGASASTASNLITVGLGFSALTLGAVSTNHLDITPRHVGELADTKLGNCCPPKGKKLCTHIHDL